MINTDIRLFETNLYKLINETSLPIEVKRVVIENAMLKLATASDAEIAKENVKKGEPNEQNS